MKLLCKASLFLRLVERAEEMTPDIISEPIYRSVLLSGAAASVMLEATDFRGNSIRLRSTSFSVAEPGRCCIPGKPLYEIIKRLQKIPDAVVSCEFDGSEETLHLRCVAFNGFLKCFPVEGFPELPRAAGRRYVEVDSIDLCRIAAKAGVPATDVGPGSVGAVEISTDAGKLWLAGYDPSRLAACAIRASGPARLDRSLLAAKGIKELQKMLRDCQGPVRVFAGENQTMFSAEHAELILQHLGVPFQDWRRLLAALKPDTRIVMELPRFMSALDRVTTLAGDQRRVFMDISRDKLKLHTKSAEMGAEEAIPLLRKEGTRQRVAFNGLSLMGILRTIEAEELGVECDANILKLYPADRPEELFVIAQMILS